MFGKKWKLWVHFPRLNVVLFSEIRDSNRDWKCPQRKPEFFTDGNRYELSMSEKWLKLRDQISYW